MSLDLCGSHQHDIYLRVGECSHAVSHMAAIWVSHMLGQPLLCGVMLSHSLAGAFPVSQQVNHSSLLMRSFLV
ncbi:hypothetical protein NQZ68_012103 [Dissostichus eleginoides]|nr:hypothetical protein NQZ68_012103 [Dissostichus eleginoides]